MSTYTLVSKLHNKIVKLDPNQRQQLMAILSEKLIARPATPATNWTPSPPAPLAQFYHPGREFALPSILAQPSTQLATLISFASQKPSNP